jgi:hypothetical protein
MSETDRKTEEDPTEGDGSGLDYCQDVRPGRDQGITSIQVTTTSQLFHCFISPIFSFLVIHILCLSVRYTNCLYGVCLDFPNADLERFGHRADLLNDTKLSSG